MRFNTTNETFALSATDLANLQRCGHLLQLDRQHAIAVAWGEADPIDATGLAVQKGREFEDRVCEELAGRIAADGSSVADLRGLERGSAEMRSALHDAITTGAEAIFQAPLRADGVGGYADILLRVADAPAPGGSLDTVHRYEPVEVKLARSVRPAFVLQACAYASALTALCGDEPEHVHVWTGDGARHEIRTMDVMASYRAAARDLATAMETDLDEALAPVPHRIGHCAGCRWADTCSARRREVDHLSLVANIRRAQVERLEDHGVTTVAQLAACDAESVPGIGRAVLPRLTAQARLQIHARTREAGEAGWEFRQPDRPGRGFALLPTPDDADIFFDFEGYPYHDSGALEYLWGWTEHDGSGGTAFRHHWCDTLGAEREALVAFLTYVTERRAASPGMHVYHYAPYEVTQLKRLADMYPECWKLLTPLLHDDVFVDLYAVVSQSMLIGVESYSIKYLEPLYGRNRDGADVANAGASIEEYERWLDTGDTAVRDAIIAYNRDDCDSTLELRNWLIDRRQEAEAAGIDWPVPPEPDDFEPEERTPLQQADLEEKLELQARLREVGRGELPEAAAHLDDATRAQVIAAARRLAEMWGWNHRELVQWYGELRGARNTRNADDYVDEPDSMGGLTLIGVEQLSRGTVVRTWQGPRQESMCAVKQIAYDPIMAMNIGTVEGVDADAGLISVRTTNGVNKRLLARGGIDWENVAAIRSRTEVPTALLEDTALRLGQGLLMLLEQGHDPFEHTSADHRVRAVLSLLGGRAPAALGVAPGDDLYDTGADVTPAMVADLVTRVDGSHLSVQGPPGTGKTWMSARVIARLVADGMRIGISSNSHAAIRNLLLAIDRHLRVDDDAPEGARGLRMAYAYGKRGLWENAPGSVLQFAKSRDAGDAFRAGDAQVLAGTAWLHALHADYDAVFIDEAGQLSLLSAAAIGRCTDRIVLVGDPQQLAQPSSVAHPENIHQSPLDLTFGDHDTLPPDRGLLLPVSRRMHPDIARWISDAFYEGRLDAYPPNRHHAIECAARPDLSGSGLRLELVKHEGCTVASEQEAQRIREIVDALLDGGTMVVDHDDRGNATEPRPLTLEDILVVAPFNRQVTLLKQALPEGARVGTVDMFQGREAPVAIWSVTSSSSEDAPRGLGFLLSPNRMNVAISRARALAIVVASPSLLGTHCSTLDEMRLTNRLHLFAERAPSEKISALHALS